MTTRTNRSWLLVRRPRGCARHTRILHGSNRPCRNRVTASRSCATLLVAEIGNATRVGWPVICAPSLDRTHSNLLAFPPSCCIPLRLVEREQALRRVELELPRAAARRLGDGAAQRGEEARRAASARRRSARGARCGPGNRRSGNPSGRGCRASPRSRPWRRRPRARTSTRRRSSCRARRRTGRRPARRRARPRCCGRGRADAARRSPARSRSVIQVPS